MCIENGGQRGDDIERGEREGERERGHAGRKRVVCPEWRQKSFLVLRRSAPFSLCPLSSVLTIYPSLSSSGRSRRSNSLSLSLSHSRHAMEGTGKLIILLSHGSHFSLAKRGNPRDSYAQTPLSPPPACD